MAGFGYSYRSQTPYDGFDPWKAERSRNSEHIRRPAHDESEGRGVVTGDPYQYPGTYVMTVETTVERVHPPMFSGYPRYEQHGPSIPSDDRPPVVEEFFNGIQNEVSQPSGFGSPRAPYQRRIPVSAGYYGSPPYQNEVSQPRNQHRIPVSAGYYGSPPYQNEASQPSGFGAPRAPYQHRIPVSAGYYDGDGDHEKERRMTNTIKEEDPKAAKIRNPPATTEGGNWHRPGNPAGYQPPSMITTGPRERLGPNMELSKPINDIGMAMEYLQKVAVPSSVEAPDPGHFKGDKIPKPPVTTEGGPAGRPGHPRGFEGGERAIQPQFRTMPMNETGKAGEYSKEAAKPTQVSTVPKRDSNPETIDSKEAKRRYGNLNPAPEQHATGYAGTIDSREAVRRYNGQFV